MIRFWDFQLSGAPPLLSFRVKPFRRSAGQRHRSSVPLAARYGKPFGRPEEIAMPPTLQELGLDRLRPEDRLAVAEAIWESVAREAQAAPLTEAQRAELERRLADGIARPEAVTPWEVIKARAQAW